QQEIVGSWMRSQKFSCHHGTGFDITLPRVEVLIIVADKIDHGNTAAVFTVRCPIRPCEWERRNLPRIICPGQRHSQYHHGEGPYQEGHVTGCDGVREAWHGVVSSIAGQARVAASA